MPRAKKTVKKTKKKTVKKTVKKNTEKTTERPVTKSIDISVIIPMKNEQGNIDQLIKENVLTLEKITPNYEIICIDDGSTDTSLQKLKAHREQNPKIKIIEMHKSFGQSPAMDAGIKHSKGQLIITMDGDLQNDPRDIPKLLLKMQEGYDVVTGWRFNRNDQAGKTFPSLLSNWLHRRLTHLKIHDSGCSLRVYKREIFDNFDLSGEQHRYLPFIISMFGYSIGEVKVNHRARTQGQTKYGLERGPKIIVDFFFLKFWLNPVKRPLHFFGRFGLFAFILTILLVLYTLFIEPAQTWLWLASLNVLILGILLIIFGYLSEGLNIVYYSTRNQKFYNIKNIYD